MRSSDGTGEQLQWNWNNCNGVSPRHDNYKCDYNKNSREVEKVEEELESKIISE